MPLSKTDQAKKQESSESWAMGVYAHCWQFCATGQGEILTFGDSEKKVTVEETKSCMDCQSSVSTSDTLHHEPFHTRTFHCYVGWKQWCQLWHVSYDMVYIIIRYFHQDSRLVKKWSFSKACPKVLKGFCITLISFHRLPHSTDMTEFFSDSALTGISKNTQDWKARPFYITSLCVTSVRMRNKNRVKAIL